MEVNGHKQIPKGYVYALKCSDGKLYIGLTRDLNTRIEEHNKGRVKTTKSRRPVQIVYSEEFDSYSDARKRELYFKSGTGRDWLKARLERWLSG